MSTVSLLRPPAVGALAALYDYGQHLILDEEPRPEARQFTSLPS